MKKGTGVYKRKESPYWWGWVTIDGMKKEFSTKQTVKTEAKKFVYAQFKRFQKGQPIDKEYEARTVKDSIKDYLNAYEHSSKKNYSDVKVILKKPIEILGRLKITELKNEHIIKYVKERRSQDISDGTIKIELDYCKAALRRGSNNKQGISEIFKLEGVDKLKPNENQHQFTQEDYLRLIKVCPAWLKLMVQIAYMFPVRAKELRDLKFHKIDLDKKIIRLEKTKNNNFRNLPLKGELYEAVKEWCLAAKDENGNYIREYVFVTPKRPKTQIKEVTFYCHYSECARKAELYRDGEKLTYHRLRATAAADLHRAGATLRVIMAYGGWDSIKTVQRYIGQAEQRDLDLGAELIGEFKKLDN
jgi:integrase